MKSPVTIEKKNPYVGKVGNSDKVKELLTKLKQTEDTVNTL